MTLPPSPPRRTVISYGTYDLSHPEQTSRLRHLRRLGDELIIGCATDAFGALHGLEASAGYAERREMLEHCRYVDRVIAQKTIGQMRTDIVNYNACVFAMDAAWTGMFDDLQDIAQVVYLGDQQEVTQRHRTTLSTTPPMRIAV